MQYRAPAADGGELAVPPRAAWAATVDRNRSLTNPLAELKRQARIETLALARELAVGERSPLAGDRLDGPLLVTGHQPELMHPGVWVKTFALSGLARKIGGIALNLVADHDTLKSTTVRVPDWHPSDPAAVRLHRVSFDTLGGEQPYETRLVRDPQQLRTFPDRVAALTASWPFEPLLPAAWACVTGRPGPIGLRFTATRKCYERQWGCHVLDLPVSRLAQIDSFRRFVRLIRSSLPQFRQAYNAAVRGYRSRHGIRSLNHPVPELADGEMPFWAPTDAAGRRGRATATSSDVRPRALTLTLFARLCLGDFFLHGIGGGKYDEVTDAIIRTYFGCEPPGYGVLSVTKHLPLPGFPADASTLRELEREARDAHWNPERHGPADPVLMATKQQLLMTRPDGRAERRAWYRAVRAVGDRLRATTPVAAPAREQIKQEAAANAVLRRRDYAWVLYPEATLRPFLQGFL